MTELSRAACEALDAEDRLAPLKGAFDLPAGTLYLDGNSLGPLPRATVPRVQRVIADEWGRDLIKSWNTAGWIDGPARVGDKIARLVGAGPGEVLAVDSTSINLYKVLSVALGLARQQAPERTRIVTERDNFPTDLYIAESLARQHGCELVLVSPDEIAAQLDAHTAVLMLTQVNYRTGRLLDMAGLTARAHAAGVVTVWDLAHSAGALPVDLKGAGADFAVGCGYKYLNGGPGSPAFVWAHPRHAARLDAQQHWQPLSGWMGHASPFEFTTAYRPAGGILRFACGTPSAIALAALECGVDTVLAAEALGGMPALRRKSLALTDLFIALVEARCGGHGLQVETPRGHAERGSHVSLYLDAADGDAYAVVQALIARGVIGDYRAPGILRFGFTPLYLGHADVWDAVEHLRHVLTTGLWRQEAYTRRAAVT